ncbi:MAG: flavin reductase [Bacteroidota bacterium]
MRKKPWNRTNQPVYSCSSQSGSQFNMHILTYVTPISMSPKRYICGIYHGTKTHELVSSSSFFVLQLLQENQYSLVNLLGKQSGNKVDKLAKLEKRQLLTQWNNFPVLKDALALLLLKPISHIEAGDHTAFLCDVVDYKNLNLGNVLTLDTLREHHLIRC